MKIPEIHTANSQSTGFFHAGIILRIGSHTASFNTGIIPPLKNITHKC
nr:MAG TPA: hypothetical protein [Caudoviricetes sp.]DAI70879.1 MAG TPA: hypothetical protein [Caudoviricetes sp.]